LAAIAAPPGDAAVAKGSLARDQLGQDNLVTAISINDPAPAPTGAATAPPRLDPALTDAAAALEAALQARAPALQAGNQFVRKLAVEVGRGLGLSDADLVAVDVCAQLRDVGMIGLPDSVILATGPLSPAEWSLVNQHPELGAELLQSLPGLAVMAPLVRAHHERWDGRGYPDGLAGEAIPLPSRVVSACDAFVAIATDRPHRRGLGAGGALDYILRERGEQFDPRVVDALSRALTGRGRERSDSTTEHSEPAGHGPDSGRRPPGLAAEADDVAAPPRRGRARDTQARSRELRTALEQFDTIPAFEPACERVLAVTEFASSLDRRELVSAIEADIGLTAAVLRVAQERTSAAAGSVTTAVGVLTPDEIRLAVTELPRMAFPWQTGFEALLLQCRVHAQAVARAADRMAHMVRPFDRDEVVTAAIVHDIGKLLLAQVAPELAAIDAAQHTPEQRVRLERRELGFDHPTLGGLLARRWGFADRLGTAVSAHHSDRPAGITAALVRLADMVVHHAHGDAVERPVMLRLAARCELSVKTLREVVFDLPHSGGSERRRAERSPLSARQTAILRLVTEGMRAAQIARELDVSESTVRTHLHEAYSRLEVADRAQAVLRATEMGWI
jgi:putative nucleotidyltransferase with HDIG domain